MADLAQTTDYTAKGLTDQKTLSGWKMKNHTHGHTYGQNDSNVLPPTPTSLSRWWGLGRWEGGGGGEDIKWVRLPSSTFPSCRSYKAAKQRPPLLRSPFPPTGTLAFMDPERNWHPCAWRQHELGMNWTERCQHPPTHRKVPLFRSDWCLRKREKFKQIL